MARNKKQNEELLQQAYQAVAEELELTPEQSVNDRVRAIILSADALQSKICQKADYIKIDAYQQVKETWPELGIPKNVWLELVHLRRLQRHTQLSDDFIAKVSMSFEGAKNVTALRMTMLEAIKSNQLDTMQVPTCESTKTLDYTASMELPHDFVELLNECAAVRHEVDSKLWTKMRLYGDAFCALTKEPYGTFKHLLDLWHYRNGGWPKATTPPRIWGTIFRFIREYDMLQQYGFDMAKSWCRRMGLETKRTLPSPTMFQFTPEAETFSQYFMAKLKDDVESKYPQYPFKPWHHLIVNGNAGFAYVWDTREIAFMFDPHAIDMQDYRTDYVDNCQPLWSDNVDIESAALANIPNVMKQNWQFSNEAQKAQQPKKPKKRVPVKFEDAFEATKAKLRQRLLDKVPSEAGKRFVEQIIGSDFLERYNWLKEHPEHLFSETYDVKWKRGDECDHIALGRGYIEGANEETGELIVHFYQHDKDYPVWMWHLNKMTTLTTTHYGTT